MEFTGRKRAPLHLNLTPLVDIIFLLLIFFMLTASFVEESALKLELPGARHGVKEEKREIEILIGRDGTVYLGKRKVEINTLPRILGEEAKKSKERVVIIRGDKGVDLGTVVKVMDAAKGAGIRAMAIATEVERQ